MIRGGKSRLNREENNFKYTITTDKLMNICKIEEISDFIKNQQQKFISHIIRDNNKNRNKRLIFNNDKRRQRGRPITTLFTQVLKNCGLDENDFIIKAKTRKF